MAQPKSLRLVTPLSEIDRYLEECLERHRKALLYALSAAAESVLTVARTTDSYKDRTGNLRSSIGYALVEDGKVVKLSGFEPVKGGKQGPAEGRQYVLELATRYPQGISLIVVAGMNYAAYVSARGYDVLESAELAAEKIVGQMLRQLGLKQG